MESPGHEVLARPDRVVAALRAAGGRFGFIHGSRVHGRPRPDSDLDIAAWFGGADPAPWTIVLPATVDLLVLDRAPLYLAGRIALHGVLLFEDDPAARVAWQGDTRLRYLDELALQREVADTFFGATRG